MTDIDTTNSDTDDFYRGVAAEFLHHYRRGPRFIAVTGNADEEISRVADLLATALRDAGAPVERQSVPTSIDPNLMRERIIAPFRSQDAVLVADGAELLSAGFRGFWNFSLWVDHDPDRDPDWTFVSSDLNQLGSPREAASVMLDGTDPEWPRRLWADFC